MSAYARPISPSGGATLADALVPGVRADGARALMRVLVLVGAGALLTALAAQLSVKLPWSPVPYTGQTAAVLLVGTVLGWRMGAASIGLYVLAGVAGAPIFSAGAHGVGQLLGYTGGYLLGFILAATVVGLLAQRGWDRSAPRAAGLMVAGNLLIYLVGVPILSAVTGMGLSAAIWNGALVFLPRDAVKVAVAAGLLPLAWRTIGRRS